MLGGCLLVTLGLLAEYGAFEIVQYQTFTVAIFTEFKLGFDAVAACVLSLVLVAVSVVVLCGELLVGGRAAGARPGPGTRRRAPRVALGRWHAAGSVRSLRAGRAVARRAGGLAGRTGWRAAARARCPSTSILAALATPPSTARPPLRSPPLSRCPIAALALRHRNRLTLLIERLAYLPMALPGLVIALGLVSFSVRYALALYQSRSS